MAMKEARIKFSKFVTKLSPELSDVEHEERMLIAKQVVEHLIRDDEWSNWITGAYLFGSTTRGKARKMSDLDIAIRTKQDFYFGGDFAWVSGRLIYSIEKAKQDLLINKRLKINPIIVAEAWLKDPEHSGITKPDILKDVLNEGILLIGEKI